MSFKWLNEGKGCSKTVEATHWLGPEPGTKTLIRLRERKGCPGTVPGYSVCYTVMDGRIMQQYNARMQYLLMG